jgi:hypothetical protein
MKIVIGGRMKKGEGAVVVTALTRDKLQLMPSCGIHQLLIHPRIIHNIIDVHTLALIMYLDQLMKYVDHYEMLLLPQNK